MKKIKLLSLSLLLLLAVGCSSTKPKSPKDNVVEEESYEKESKDELEIKEYNKLAHEDDDVKITLKAIEEVGEDKYGEDAVEVIFEVENKLKEDVALQVESMSADGKMINESNITSSTEIQAEKTADAYVSIVEYNGYEIPDMEKDIEVDFVLFSWENEDLRKNIKVKIDLQ